MFVFTHQHIKSGIGGNAELGLLCCVTPCCWSAQQLLHLPSTSPPVSSTTAVAPAAGGYSSVRLMSFAAADSAHSSLAFQHLSSPASLREQPWRRGLPSGLTTNSPEAAEPLWHYDKIPATSAVTAAGTAAAVTSKPEPALDVHGPVELVEQALVENLLNGHLVALAPCDGDSRVHVVDLAGAQGYCLEVFLDRCGQLSLLQRGHLPGYLRGNAAAHIQQQPCQSQMCLSP